MRNRERERDRHPTSERGVSQRETSVTRPGACVPAWRPVGGRLFDLHRPSSRDGRRGGRPDGRGDSTVFSCAVKIIFDGDRPASSRW